MENIRKHLERGIMQQTQIFDTETILGFLENRTSDYKARYHSDILYFSDDQLEECHDQIQWMFPLHESSAFAQTYPVLTPESLKVIRESKVVERNMFLAYQRMVYFYGLHDPKSERYLDWTASANGRPNHNLLRITRIIRSLRFMELDQLAINLYYLIATNTNINCHLNDKTLEFWEKALKDDIWNSLK
jgi:hypothetical protein